MTLTADNRGVVIYNGEPGIVASQMYRTYQAWCLSLKAPIVPEAKLESTLRTKFPDFLVRVLNVNGKVSRVFFGVPLRTSNVEHARA